MSDRRRGGIDYQKTSDLEKKATQRQTEDLQSLDEQNPTALTTATDAETIARNIAALKARKKHKKSSTSRATSRSGTDTDTAPANKLPASNKKVARKWDNGKSQQMILLNMTSVKKTLRVMIRKPYRLILSIKCRWELVTRKDYTKLQITIVVAPTSTSKKKNHSPLYFPKSCHQSQSLAHNTQGQLSCVKRMSSQ